MWSNRATTLTTNARQVTVALNWFGRKLSNAQQGPRSALGVLESDCQIAQGNELLRFNRYEAPFVLIFSMLLSRQGLCRRKIEMNNVNPGMKPVADHRDPETKSTATDGVQVNELAQDDVLSITTTNNTYHVTVIDPVTAKVRVRGGDFFRHDTLAQIAGSSLNSSIKPFGIYIGYSIEFFVHARRVRTSQVRAIRVLGESERVA